jgi:hypothetical protein
MGALHPERGSDKMVQPMNGGAFGRRGLAVAPVTVTALQPPLSPPPQEETSWPAPTFLERIFLWLPNEAAPGFLAVCLVLLRQAILPFVLMLAPFVLIALLSPQILAHLGHGAGAPKWQILSVVPFAFGCFALVQELGRYSFVRRAEQPLRAISIFTATTVVAILLVYHTHLYTCLWMTAAQLAASAALVYVLPYRRYIPVVIAILIVGQTAIDVNAPGLFRAANTGSTAQQAGIPTGAANVSTDAPSAGNMQAWAKVYPGAVWTRNETQTFGPLTEWTVHYTVQATPDQVGAFYEALANTEGFTDTQTILSFHRFRQDSTRNDFSYFVVAGAAGSDVIFTARTFTGLGGSPG